MVQVSAIALKFLSPSVYNGIGISTANITNLLGIQLKLLYVIQKKEPHGNAVLYHHFTRPRLVLLISRP
jgi:hypothetical protein